MAGVVQAETLGSWGVYETEGLPHVAPIADMQTHTLSASCWCRPVEDDGVFVHHSMDRREERERPALLS